MGEKKKYEWDVGGGKCGRKTGIKFGVNKYVFLR